MIEHGRFGRKIPEEWRKAYTSWVEQLNLSWLDLQRHGGADRHLAEKIAVGELSTAKLSTLRKMTEALPIGEVDKKDLLALLGIEGRQRDFGTISVEWGGREGTFGDHANRLLWGLGLRTRPQFQAVADIGLPKLQFVGLHVRRVGPDQAMKDYLLSG